MTLSPAFKQAFKIALAMVISYAIALWMGWDKPLWSGLAVAVGCLASVGDSVGRGLQRLLGTAFAGVVTIILASLFLQDRFSFLLLMSLFVALCNYMLCYNQRYFTFWLCAGFTVPLVAFIGDGLSVNTFDTIIERTNETALGLLVYSIVGVLIWPQNAGNAFKSQLLDCVRQQAELFDRLREQSRGRAAPANIEQLIGSLRQKVGALTGSLDAAVFDSDDIWRSRAALRHMVDELASTLWEMERWYLCYEDLKDVDLGRALPGLQDYLDGLKKQFTILDYALETGSQPGPQLVREPVTLDRDVLREFPHFIRAAIVLRFDQLISIGDRIDALVKAADEINGGPADPLLSNPKSDRPSMWVPDADALAATVRQTTVLWIVLLMAIYMPEFGNIYVGFIAITNALAMGLSMAPFAPVRILYKPAIFGTIFSGLLYILVMPALSGYLQLSIMIFIATFLIAYVLDDRKYYLAKVLGLVMFVVVTDVTNEQSYSVYWPANWLLAMILFCLIHTIAWRLPISFRPQERFPAILERFFSSAEALLPRTGSEISHKRHGLFQRWLRDYHLYNVKVLPQRLRVWARMLQTEYLAGDKRAELNRMLTGIEALANWVIAASRHEADGPQRLPPSLVTDIVGWEDGLHGALKKLSNTEVPVDSFDWRSRVDARFEHMETQVENLLNQADYEALPMNMRGAIYRKLGEYRGLSEAVVAVAGAASNIDWTAMKRSRL